MKAQWQAGHTLYRLGELSTNRCLGAGQRRQAAVVSAPAQAAVAALARSCATTRGAAHTCAAFLPCG